MSIERKYDALGLWEGRSFATISMKQAVEIAFLTHTDQGEENILYLAWNRHLFADLSVLTPASKAPF